MADCFITTQGIDIRVPGDFGSFSCFDPTTAYYLSRNYTQVCPWL